MTFVSVSSAKKPTTVTTNTTSPQEKQVLSQLTFNFKARNATLTILCNSPMTFKIGHYGYKTSMCEHVQLNGGYQHAASQSFHLTASDSEKVSDSLAQVFVTWAGCSLKTCQLRAINTHLSHKIIVCMILCMHVT